MFISNVIPTKVNVLIWRRTLLKRVAFWLAGYLTLDSVLPADVKYVPYYNF